MILAQIQAEVVREPSCSARVKEAVGLYNQQGEQKHHSEEDTLGSFYLSHLMFLETETLWVVFSLQLHLATALSIQTLVSAACMDQIYAACGTLG